MLLSEKSNPHEKGKMDHLRGTSHLTDVELPAQEQREREREHKFMNRVMMSDTIRRITGLKTPSAVLMLIVAIVSICKMLTL